MSLCAFLQFLILFLAVIQTAQNSSAQQALSSSESSSRAHKNGSREPVTAPDTGSLSNGVYHNSFFGLRYKVPFGWVDRTQEMQEKKEPGKSQVLLAMFERPPQAVGDKVNSAVIIAAESVASYPGLKTAADYFEPLTQVTSSKGFQVVNDPYEVAIGSKPLVRADFSKDLGSIKMLQTTLAVLQRGYVLSFTFIAGDDEQMDRLVEGLNFGANKARGTGQSPAPH